MILKVCGMRDPENIRALEQLMQEVSQELSLSGTQLHWLMGFIFFAKSPRHVGEIPSYLPDHVERTGVFVNESTETILCYVEKYQLSYVQLHGKESPSQCRELRSVAKVIKAFSIENEEDLLPIEKYEGCCDLFLFDTKCENYGGSGRQFEWSLLHGYGGATPFLLSGGIDSDSIPALQKFCHPQLMGYDLNSRFEQSPALKDITLLREFFKAFPETKNSLPNHPFNYKKTR